MSNKSNKIIDHIKSVLMSESFKTKHRKKDSAFIRNRILSFVELVVIQINRLVLSLNVELEIFLDLIDSNQSYSKQAFSKARQLFSHSAFIELNKIYIQGFYEEDSYLKYKDDYILLAVDGSLCQLPESKEVADYFIRWKNHLPPAPARILSCGLLKPHSLAF